MVRKTPKCWMCGQKLTATWMSSGDYRTGCYRVGCKDCGWAAYFLSAVQKWSIDSAKEFMAKIPPTMRVREGDTVLMRFGEEVKSVKIRAVTNTTLFETDEGIVSPDSIEKWPWELEEEEGGEWEE